MSGLNDIEEHIKQELDKFYGRLRAWPNVYNVIQSMKPMAINLKSLLGGSDKQEKFIFVSNDPAKVYKLATDLISLGIMNRNIQMDNLSIIRVEGPNNNQWIPKEFLPTTRSKSVVLCGDQQNNMLVLETFIAAWFAGGAKIVCLCTRQGRDLSERYRNVINLDTYEKELKL